MKKEMSELPPEVQAQIRALETLPEDQIDTTDAPEILDWSDARRGVFCRHGKQQITPRPATKPWCWRQLAQFVNQPRRSGSWGLSRNTRMSNGGWPRGIFSRRVPRRE